VSESVEEFLARGGKIKQIEPDTSNIKSKRKRKVTFEAHRTRKKKLVDKHQENYQEGIQTESSEDQLANLFSRYFPSGD